MSGNLTRIVFLQLIIASSCENYRPNRLVNLFNCKLDDVIDGIDFLTNVMNGTLAFTNKLKMALKDFQIRTGSGFPRFDFSSLEPLIVDRIDINVKHPALSLSGYEENVKIKHLSDVQLDAIKIREANVFVNVSFPVLEIDGFYDITGEVAEMFKIFGKGNYWMKLFNFSITSFFELGMSAETRSILPIKSFQLTPKLQSLENNLDGLMGDDREITEAFNQCFTSLAPGMLDMLWPKMANGVRKQLLEIANDRMRWEKLDELQRIVKFEFKSEDD